MASKVVPRRVGVDVGNKELWLSVDGAAPQRCANRRSAIRRWLEELAAPAEFALEATNDYHLPLALEAHHRGHRVYLLNGYRLNRYRESLGIRAKTDAGDARLLARYLERERADLRPWSPPPQSYTQLQGLLRRRATLVQARVRLQQSLQGIPELQAHLQHLVDEIQRIDTAIQRRIQQVVAAADWQAHVRRCRQLEGVGALTAAALTMAFHRGHFQTSDAFIAFVGLDVRVRDSGQQRARRRLTKAGDPELRRLLFLAAMQAKSKPAWQAFYQRHLKRGLAPIQALNVLARKLARVAFALMKNQTDYQPRIPCTAT